MLRIWFILFSLLSLVAAARAQNPPMPSREAAARMKLPEGFQVTLFAGEPDVVQPIAFTFDDRGRLWVAECLSYPKWQPTGRDRIVIFEDTDGDGQFDKRTVFHDQIANISGLVYGHGGVWVCATPNLLFIPDRNGDDVPDGPPEVILDGWDMKKAQHNVFNGLAWGPDGWLYGCNGIQSQSLVGKPGTPNDQRTPINCGVWRYHPTRKKFEVVATGTTNPWGLDFDDYGQMFITNCVIHHLWHVIPGSHFQRMYGQDSNPHWYSLMQSCADHIHWAGGAWQSSRGAVGSHSDRGGGHAHSGAMVYLGDNWPKTYRNGVFMCNLHGRRVNHDVLEQTNLGYVAHHGKDFLFAEDPWFRGIALQYGPDGGVFITDWSDTGECHNYDVAHKTSGRIYKVTYGKPGHKPVDLARLSDDELVALQRHPNDWHVRHARRLLQERWLAGKLSPSAREQLFTLLREERDVPKRLRALWALFVTGGFNEGQLLSLLSDSQDLLRAWTITLALDEATPSKAILERLTTMAQEHASPIVRTSLISALQRLPLPERLPLAAALIRQGEIAADTNLTLLLWYGIEPLIARGTEQTVELLKQTQIRLLREYVARRLISLEAVGSTLLTRYLQETSDAMAQADVLRGMLAVLGTLRRVPAPPGWTAVAGKLTSSTDPEVQEQALYLSALFDDAHALQALTERVRASERDPASRQRALQMLIHKRQADLAPLLQQLVDDRMLRGAAIRGLGSFANDQTPAILVKHYASLTEEEKQDVISTLSARVPYALALLAAVESGQIPRKDLSAYTVRQMLALKNKEVSTRLNQVWGVIRPASQEKAAQMARYKALLTPEHFQGANRSRGRQLYVQTCAACHRLFDDGGRIGPELTGGQRNSLDYWLENILDPSAVVFGEYQVTTIETRDGRLLHGIIKSENEKSVTLQTQTDSVVIPKSEIESRAKSNLSLMPDGLLANLKDDEVRDLIAYLSGSGQVPLPVGKKPD